MNLINGLPLFWSGTNCSLRTWTPSGTLIPKIVYGNGVCVVTEVGGVVWSENGLDWTEVAFSDGDPKDICFANGVFVIVGPNGKIFRSSNGKDWFTHDTGSSANLSTIAFGNGVFVIGSSASPYLMISENGADWTSVTFGSSVTKIVFGKEGFVLLANTATGPAYYSSTDGKIWTLRFSAPALEVDAHLDFVDRFVVMTLDTTSSPPTATYIISEDGIDWKVLASGPNYSDGNNLSWSYVTKLNEMYVGDKGISLDNTHWYCLMAFLLNGSAAAVSGFTSAVFDGIRILGVNGSTVLVSM